MLDALAKKWPLLGIGIWSALMLLVSFRGGITVSDYPAYIQQWGGVLSGPSPWVHGNTYGPLHNLLAPLLLVSPIAAKFFMVGCMLAANAALVSQLLLLSPTGLHPSYLLFVPANLVVIISGAFYGNNDALVAALLVIAILARHRKYLVWAGIFIGLAALEKYYPLLLLPFLALDGRRLDWRVLVSGGGVFCVGIVSAIVLWGPRIFSGIAYGAARPSKLLSFLSGTRALLGAHNPIVQFLERTNTEMVLVGVAAVLFIAWKRRLHWLPALVIAYMVELTIYRVGHPQFQLPLLFAPAALPLWDDRRAERLQSVFVPWAVFLTIYICSVLKSSPTISASRLDGSGFTGDFSLRSLRSRRFYPRSWSCCDPRPMRSRQLTRPPGRP